MLSDPLHCLQLCFVEKFADILRSSQPKAKKFSIQNHPPTSVQMSQKTISRYCPFKILAPYCKWFKVYSRYGKYLRRKGGQGSRSFQAWANSDRYIHHTCFGSCLPCTLAYLFVCKSPLKVFSNEINGG